MWLVDWMFEIRIVAVLTIVFWISLTISSSFAGRSWFPFTVFVPSLLLILAAGIDRLLPGAGAVLLLLVHVVLVGGALTECGRDQRSEE